jgi:hypothetical protein
MAVTDDIGRRGEALFVLLCTRFCGRRGPFFRPYFLGDKFATIDYLVELVDAGPGTPFFFVQVKTTTQGYTRPKAGRKRLRVQVVPDDMQRLVLYPAPTYVVGIDERDEIGYIVSANHDGPVRIASLPTTFPLDCHNMARLWDEVKQFWEQRDMRLLQSVFSE